MSLCVCADKHIQTTDGVQTAGSSQRHLVGCFHPKRGNDRDALSVQKSRFSVSVLVPWYPGVKHEGVLRREASSPPSSHPPPPPPRWYLFIQVKADLLSPPSRL